MSSGTSRYESPFGAPEGAVPPRLVVVGSIAYDSIETPHGKRERVLGGAACYFSWIASFYTRVGLSGVIGRDFELELLSPFRERGIDLSGVQSDTENDSFFWRGRYEGDMNSAQTLETRLNALGVYEPTLPAHYRKAPFVFLANTHPAVQNAVLDQLDEGAFSCCDSMNFWIENEPDELRRVLERVDGFFCNDAEARSLAGTTNLIHAGRKLLELGLKFAVVKKGEHGALLFHREGVFGIPAFPTKDVKDPTGAGDSFAGGFMGALAAAGEAGAEQLRAALFEGTVMASFTVEGFGLERLFALDEGSVAERRRQLRDFLPKAD